LFVSFHLKANFIYDQRDGQLYAFEADKLKKTNSNSNSNSSSTDIFAYGASNQKSRVPTSPVIPENYTSFDQHQDKESSEDQGVYCLATGTSFSMSSNISSVTNSQFVDSDYIRDVSSNESTHEASCVIPINPINMTRLSLFEMTPSRKQIGCTFVNELNSNQRVTEKMKEWIVSNYNQNCVNQNHQLNENLECII